AMAGLDYSNVVEPDYNKDKLKQSRDITEYTKKISELVYNKWKNKENLWKENFKGIDQVERTRQIYYDTDGIMENQTQNFKICNKCSGVNTIKSRNDRGDRIFAITIPRDACSNCIDEGYRLYRNTSSSFTNVYLQDRVNDEYFSK
ncbi:MAG: histone deacetylase, partial [Tissierellia bacterium]|nr:histone deacetylase [Tissierellia bacterium]